MAEKKAKKIKYRRVLYFHGTYKSSGITPFLSSEVSLDISRQLVWNYSVYFFFFNLDVCLLGSHSCIYISINPSARIRDEIIGGHFTLGERYNCKGLEAVNWNISYRVIENTHLIHKHLHIYVEQKKKINSLFEMERYKVINFTKKKKLKITTTTIKIKCKYNTVQYSTISYCPYSI